MFAGDRYSYFVPTIFTRRKLMAASTFIKAMHPKSELLPEPSAIEKILAMGWVG